MIKLNRVAMLAIALVLGNAVAFADDTPKDIIDYDAKPAHKVIYPVNGQTGFVFNKLNQVFKSNTQGYDTIIVDSSTALSAAQITEIQKYLEQGITIIIDAKAGMGTAQAVAQKIAGFSINSEAIMIKKSTDSKGGYDVTPIASNAYGSKAAATDSTSTAEHVSNTIDDVFGL